MEKRILGIFLSIVGVTGLVWAVARMIALESSAHLPGLFAGGILGVIFFFSGIRLVPGRNEDLAGRNEDIR